MVMRCEENIFKDSWLIVISMNSVECSHVEKTPGINPLRCPRVIENPLFYRTSLALNPQSLPPAAKGLLFLNLSPKAHSKSGAGIPNPIAMKPNKLFPHP